MDRLAEQVIEMLRQAGKIILECEIDKDKIIQKGAGNYVTQVDFQVQNFLVDKIRRMSPASNIITEESASNQFNLEKTTWILDPVDGTTNLMRGYRPSAISLALFARQKPVFGVVYNPFADEMFTAYTGQGAFLNNQTIKASKNLDLQECLIAFGTTPYQRERAAETFRITERIFMRCLEIRRSGSAALDIVHVACGRLDGFYEYNLQPWDYAAGMIILAEAGGRTTTWQGNPLGVLAPSSVLATNGLIHQEMLNLISE
jgi:Archaeal fructose-1,6-bisphosphatase and related enzymes of inositol monophosphatase family